MASTYTTDLRIEKMANGADSGTWGDKTNTNWDLIEQAVAGVASVAMTDAEYTLTTSNGASDEARNMVITMTGTLTGAQNVIVPSVDKLYTFKNSTTGGYSIVVKTAAGTGITILNGETEQLYCDATNVLRAQTTPTGSGAPVRATSPTLVTPKSTTTIGVGNATPSASGSGLSFPATQDASTDANTLDDYEEGTWTPAFAASGATFNYAANGQIGSYTKIGRKVTITARLQLATSGNTLVGQPLTISGLPFACRTSTNLAFTAACAFFSIVTSISGLHGVIASGGSSITVYGVVAAGGTQFEVMSDTDMSATAGTIIIVTATYESA